MTPRRFPILYQNGSRKKYPNLADSILWSAIAPHEKQAMLNHGGQSLEVLASRGGLDPTELAAVLQDKKWERISEIEATAVVRKLAVHIEYPELLCATCQEPATCLTRSGGEREEIRSYSCDDHCKHEDSNAHSPVMSAESYWHLLPKDHPFYKEKK